MVVALNLEPAVWRGLCLPYVTGMQSEVEATSCRRQSRSAGRECLEQLGCGEHWPISGGGKAKLHLTPRNTEGCVSRLPWIRLWGLFQLWSPMLLIWDIKGWWHNQKNRTEIPDIGIVAGNLMPGCLTCLLFKFVPVHHTTVHHFSITLLWTVFICKQITGSYPKIGCFFSPTSFPGVTCGPPQCC